VSSIPAFAQSPALALRAGPATLNVSNRHRVPYLSQGPRFGFLRLSTTLACAVEPPLALTRSQIRATPLWVPPYFRIRGYEPPPRRAKIGAGRLLLLQASHAVHSSILAFGVALK